MVALASTKMSSKGQVVIPQEIREAMGFKPGARFMVVTVGSDLVFKAMPQPDLKEFRALAKKVQAAAKKAGITPKDVEQAIKDVRARRKRA
jgi:AbrB family looped-hinge helix DNA binding protein